ncbi:MAG: hypothetical protein A2677_00405 [Candidatus Komeilibacteria bacterium RIFCSPHIGHO2_01_FULL_52_14]|uniref:Uncharacterized protein n=1 Tax=Candidatus Komeilibacteria bacterium RIFCSPHIGHO2_01_FULL_52_14 TaxID=1798549 RepID=A0A1G2BLT2_9BACT|nr:MAG: hypothetical protein A2677_00405 [Candidatus Komeilibacteria bacterium RIFCSPHIGHO2_01_FULL_52_14]
MENGNGQKIKKGVLEAISSGSIKMRPRWYFVLHAVLAIAAISLLGMTLLYLVSLIFFLLRLSGVWFAPLFGFRGWYTFLISLPWLLILLTILFLFLLEIAGRRFPVVYRRPLLYSVVGIVAIAVAGGFALERVHMHDQLFSQARENTLPIGGELYRNFGMRHLRGVHQGAIIDTMNGGFTIQEANGKSYSVQVSQLTRRVPQRGMRMMIISTSTFQLNRGDGVVIYGPEDDGIIQAIGIQKILVLPFGPRFPHDPNGF